MTWNEKLGKELDFLLKKTVLTITEHKRQQELLDQYEDYIDFEGHKCWCNSQPI